MKRLWILQTRQHVAGFNLDTVPAGFSLAGGGRQPVANKGGIL